jgi:hypothetical protein
MNASFMAQAPAPAGSPDPRAFGAQGQSQLVAQFRQGLQNRQNRKLLLAGLIVGGLFLLVHDWSGGRVEARVRGNWTASLTDGTKDWQMNWTIKSKGGYEVETLATEAGQVSVGRNNILNLVPKGHARRTVQMRVKDQQTIYLNGPVFSPGAWTEWAYDGKGGGQGVTLVGTWVSKAQTPGLRGVRVLEIDTNGGYKFAERLQAAGEMRAKDGEFVMQSEYDDYGDAGKYQIQAGKLSLSSKRYKTLVFQRPQ